MSSVTQRIKEITQPRGGYLKPSEFECIELEDGKVLFEDENIHASLVGLVVDYMTRFIMGTNVKNAFSISILGAKNAEMFGYNGSINELNKYLTNITGLNKKSIINACKAVTFDVWYRNLPAAMASKAAADINPDDNTISNIITMIERSISFWNKYGPIEVDGFTFEGGYTSIVNTGDGDYLTKSTLWDFKVSKQGLKSAHTLQLLMYYIMGKHSEKNEFENITHLGVFNPRTNKVFLKNIEEIPTEIIDEVSTEVIGYGKEKTQSIVNKKNNNNISKGNDDFYDVKEIMNILNCSRYMVMKYYNTEGLPLFKSGTKYYVSKNDLMVWIENQRKAKIILTIIYIVCGLLYLIAILVIFHYTLRW